MNKRSADCRELPGRNVLIRKLSVTFIISVLLVGLYFMIFRFSSQDAEASGGLSQTFSMKCMQVINLLVGGRFGEEDLVRMAEAIEHPVRKLAHFSEYGYMGVLVYILLSQWMRRGRGLYLWTVLWVLLSAACDEFHQYFVPGRYASLADVALDTCGGVCGMLFCICAAALYRRYKEARERKHRRPERK